MSKANSKRLTDPLVGINRRTATGREVRDLYRSRMAAIGGKPDATLQAAVRRAVELQLISERFRAEMLATNKFDIGTLEELVRVENMHNRAEKHVAELIAQLPPTSSWDEDDA